jgi:hypothetical protein
MCINFFKKGKVKGNNKINNQKKEIKTYSNLTYDDKLEIHEMTSKSIKEDNANK